jgi:hypothetical protein
MARGRPLVPLLLSDSERETLESWTRRRTTAHALAQRAGIVLACAGGKANRTVAGERHLHEDTIGKWRLRCADRDQVGCHASRSMRPRICPNTRRVK